MNESSDTNKLAGISVESGGTFGGGLDVVMGDNTYLYVASSNALTSATNLTLNSGSYLVARVNTVTATLGNLSGAGSVTSTATSYTMTLDGGADTGTYSYSGKIGSDASISGSKTAIYLVKTGSSTQVLSGTMNYTGSTTVSGGTLLVNGTHVQAAAGSGYIVNTGGTLGGTGRIARFATSGDAVSVASGGFIAAGGADQIGTFTLDGVNHSGTGKVLNMASGAQFNFDVAGSASDTIAFWNYVAGDVGLSSNAINVNLLGAVASGTYTADLFHFYTDNGDTLSSSSITSGFVLGSLDSEITGAALIYNSGSGTVQLQYTVVASTIPESSHMATVFGALAIGASVVLRRRAMRA